MTTFLLIRHAATDAVGRRIAGWTPGVHLNADGRVQAARLADRLVHWPIAAIYSSPLERARETAAPLAEALGLTVQASDALGELHYGEWTDVDLTELAARPSWQRWNSFRSGTRVPGGELMLELQARMVGALASLCALHPDETVALISHAEAIRGALAHYLGIPLDMSLRLEVAPASVSVLALHDWGPRLLRVNDTGDAP
jgi:probable phosphomutase (TIGR03848 family)